MAPRASQHPSRFCRFIQASDRSFRIEKRANFKLKFYVVFSLFTTSVFSAIIGQNVKSPNTNPTTLIAVGTTVSYRGPQTLPSPTTPAANRPASTTTTLAATTSGDEVEATTTSDVGDESEAASAIATTSTSYQSSIGGGYTDEDETSAGILGTTTNSATPTSRGDEANSTLEPATTRSIAESEIETTTPSFASSSSGPSTLVTDEGDFSSSAVTMTTTFDDGSSTSSVSTSDVDAATATATSTSEGQSTSSGGSTIFGSSTIVGDETTVSSPTSSSSGGGGVSGDTSEEPSTATSGNDLGLSSSSATSEGVDLERWAPAIAIGGSALAAELRDALKQRKGDAAACAKTTKRVAHEAVKSADCECAAGEMRAASGDCQRVRTATFRASVRSICGRSLAADGADAAATATDEDAAAELAILKASNRSSASVFNTVFSACIKRRHLEPLCSRTRVQRHARALGHLLERRKRRQRRLHAGRHSRATQSGRQAARRARHQREHRRFAIVCRAARLQTARFQRYRAAAPARRRSSTIAARMRFVRRAASAIVVGAPTAATAAVPTAPTSTTRMRAAIVQRVAAGAFL